ncbi:MAG TPA: hypothetical protein VGI19_11870 [Candidatus Cybelea sp.]
MNTTGFLKYAGALIVVAICSACSGALRPAQGDMPVAPSNAALNNELTTAARPNRSAVPLYQTLVPDRHTRAKFFEYVINFYGTYASIFDYPKSDKEIGTIQGGVGGQGCTNVLYGYGKKTFWIVAGQTQIQEYKVEKKLIKTLSTTAGMPSSCAMNGSGDLAVGILSNGDIAIYKNASGSGTVMTTPLAAEWFDGYDTHGNLFFDGYSRSGYFQLDELPNGSSKIQTISTSNSPQVPGSVQWDGKYLTVGDQGTNEIYRYTISGAKATLKGTVRLSGAGDCGQTWIATGVVFCGDAGTDGGEVFNYPAGGSPAAVFTGNFDTPLGMVAAER